VSFFLSYHVTYSLSCSVYFPFLLFAVSFFVPTIFYFLFSPHSFVSSFPSYHLLLLCISSLISLLPFFLFCLSSFWLFIFIHFMPSLILFQSIFFSVFLSYHVTYFLSYSVYFSFPLFAYLPSFRPFLIFFFSPHFFVSSFPSCHLFPLCLSSLISLLPSFISCIFHLSSSISLLLSHFLLLCFPPCPDSKAALRSLTPVSLLIHLLTHYTFLPLSGTIDHISNIPLRLALQGLLTAPNAA
jgi:hypothetical protein